MVEEQVQQEVKASFNFKDHPFVVPTNRIITPADVERFKAHESSKELLGFLQTLQMALKRTSMAETALTANCKPVSDWLDEVSAMVDEVPPVDQPMRFGNKAFRTLIEKMNETIENKVKAFSALEGFDRAVPELMLYLQESFGSYERIDYGTGHELNFVVFIFCMCKIGAFAQDDWVCAINCIFQKYMILIRKIQLIYMLEPAGSHGVWGLDDYQHLAFFFGACQLQGHEDYFPKSIHNEMALRDDDQYMYFGCINFIKSVKKGVHFGEGSPMLNDISAVPSWEKVAGGLFKMFDAEVISKHPVIKHLKFGSILNFE